MNRTEEMVKKILVVIPVLQVVLIAAFAALVSSVSNISIVSANDHSQLITDIYGWRDGHSSNLPHVYRWNRVLLALGEDVDGVERMYSTEAQVYVNSGWKRWEQVLTALKQVERANSITPPAYDGCIIDAAGIVREATQDSSDPYEMLLQWSVEGPDCDAGPLRLEERVSGVWDEVFSGLGGNRPLGEGTTYREGEYKEGVSAGGIREREFRLVASDGRISNVAVVDGSGFAPLNIWVQADRYLGIVVNWDAAPGASGWVTDYRVEWRDSDGTIKSVLKGGNTVTNHRIVGLNYTNFVPTPNGNLVEGETYTVRVVAVSGTGDDAEEVASVWSVPVTTYHVPLKIWIRLGTPTLNSTC